MVWYKPRVAHPFVLAQYPGVSTSVTPPQHVPQSFRSDWVNDNGARVITAGPFSYINVNRSQPSPAPPAGPSWHREAADDTFYTGDKSREEFCPIANYKDYEYSSSDIIGLTQLFSGSRRIVMFLLGRLCPFCRRLVKISKIKGDCTAFQ